VSLAGRTALVTGGGRGVGEGIAQVLAENGAAVAVNDLHEDRAAGVVEQLRAIGVEAMPAVFDITDYAAVERGVAEIEATLGPLDILVNNAGIPEGYWSGPFAESKRENWEPFVELNVYGQLNVVRVVLPGLVERGWGRIIQISSGAGARGLPAGVGESLYGSSKAFMDSFLRHVALEIARTGVTFNAVAPGLMTSAAVYASEETLAAVLANVPIGRLGEPREVGAAVAWLASEPAGYVTGQVIHVNGGSYQGR
jgi:NAD(P)-dependent dehydrogenase (short-subunit alcohol dehydrogenase family)